MVITSDNAYRNNKGLSLCLFVSIGCCLDHKTLIEFDLTRHIYSTGYEL